MSKKVKVVLNRAGVGELLKSQAMMDVCEQHAKKVLKRCGEKKGYEMSTHVGKYRVNATVRAGTVQAKQDNRENNTILKAVGR